MGKWEQPPAPTGSPIVKSKGDEKTCPERLLYSDAVHQTTLAIKESKHEQLHLSFIAYHSQNLYLILKEKFKIWPWHIDFSKVDMCLPIKWESFPESKDRAIKCHLLAINLMRFANSRSMKEEGHLADLSSWEEEGGMCLRRVGPRNSIIIILSFLRLSFALHVASSSSTVDRLLPWPVCLQTALVIHHADLGTLEEKESFPMYMNSKGGCHLMLPGSHATTPWLKLYGWQTLWMGRPVPSWDIIRKIYLVSASGSWHRAPKILVISQIIGIYCALTFSLSFWFLKREIPRCLNSSK